MKKANKAVKALLCLAVILFTIITQVVLGKQTGIRNKSEDMRPPLFDTPSYVELMDGQSLTVDITAKENAHMGSFSVVLVNTDTQGSGTIDFSFKDSTLAELWNITVSESSITIGEWNSIGNPDVYFEAGKEYQLVISANGCSPYFIKTQIDATNRVLPFTEAVEGQSTGISLGISVVSDEPLTYADIFYHSRFISIVICLALLLWIIFGLEIFTGAIEKVRKSGFTDNVLGDVFLCILFVTLCLSIYINGYLEGINISADSAGYLREAVNMAAGNGFHYDGLAGYSNTWFANWPILYPAMIALVMKLTGLEVYAASKVLSMILVGVLLLIIRLTFKKDAWFYGLFATNLGLMYLYWYSWSELPFIIFMLLFAISLHKVLDSEDNRVLNYVFLGTSAFLCFLVRYFGIFTYFVIGLYMLVMIIDKFSGKRAVEVRKIVFLGITAFVSGCMCILYLVNNKIQNGMPSGVSRSMWWDDYQSLTNDLIKALLAEIFNVFHMEVPAFISGLSYDKGALVVILVVILLAVCVLRNAKHYSRESVLITTAFVYYGMFIVIRYFSSMDTFYYRFFAPATFLFTLGFAVLLTDKLKGTDLYKGMLISFTALMCIFAVSDYSDHIAKNKLPYYEIVQMSWDEDYAEIPDRSVVIFSTLDYRSLYYRYDVIEGTIAPDDTMDTLRERYFGSRQMCILNSDAKTMLESGIYDEGINKAIESRINDSKYCVIPLD